MNRRLRWGLWTVAIVLLSVTSAVIPRPLSGPVPDTVFIEELTWVEVREAIRAGKTTVIVPTGGVEQNGPHLVLGKHNYIVRHTARQIAMALGDALVAPIVTYVPEGEIDPPSVHMLFPGTITIPESTFAEILEYAARSLRASGFQVICLLGDSGGNQQTQKAVTAKLNSEWARSGVRVVHVGDYYDANGQIEFLKGRGETTASIGFHAGIRDSSELMAVFPGGIRKDRIARNGGWHSEPTGVNGDPTRASAKLGAVLLQLKINAALRQIRAALGRNGDLSSRDVDRNARTSEKSVR